jgi:hypothetical protein
MNILRVSAVRRFGSRVGAVVLLAAAALCSGGCVGYRVGSTLPPNIRSVHVPTFVNRSGEPEVDTMATRATIDELQRDGTLTVSSRQSADTILEVTIVKFKLQPVRYSSGRAKTAREYRARIAVNLVFKLKRSGEVLRKKRVEGEATFETGSDLSLAKRRAIPLAARDLAHDIVEAVVEAW